MKELDVQFFEKNGFSDPLLLLTEEKTHELVEELENYIKSSIGPNPNNPLQSRHIDRPLIRKICNSDYLLNQICTLCVHREQQHKDCCFHQLQVHEARIGRPQMR